jgi:hypothetical protein
MTTSNKMEDDLKKKNMEDSLKKRMETNLKKMKVEDNFNFIGKSNTTLIFYTGRRPKFCEDGR